MSAVATPNAWKRPRATSDVKPRAPAAAGLAGLLKPYAGLIGGLAALTMLGNSLNLLVPRIVARAIDSYTRRELVLAVVSRELLLAALGIALFTYLQSIVQTYASERVARDLRTRLVAKISVQDHAYVQQVTPGDAADAPDLGCRRHQDCSSRMAIASLDLVGVPDRRRQRAAAVDRLAAGAGGAGDAADHRVDVLHRAGTGAASCSPRRRKRSTG